MINVKVTFVAHDEGIYAKFPVSISVMQIGLDIELGEKWPYPMHMHPIKSKS
jgi:hypothetical protein